MRNRKAFTLVELLVVIAIIALLISILVPSLKAARDLAKELFCKTNMNAVNKTIGVYAELNRGFMMVYLQDKEPFYDKNQQVYKAFACFKQDTSDSSGPCYANQTNNPTGLFPDAKGFGLAYVMKLIEPAELFYCPSQTDERSTRAYYGYDHPWGSYIPDLTKSGFIRISYMYNPWVVLDSNSNLRYEDGLVLDKHPNDRFTTSDLITRRSNVAHSQGNIVKWNLAYPDGHVSSKSERDYNNLTTPRNICCYFQRLSNAGIDSEEAGFIRWGRNDYRNSTPMGLQLNPTGTVRFELLSKVE